MLSQRNPALHAKIVQMALPLAPLVALPTGQKHPAYPSTLNFWLLTSTQLDDLARFYHQRTPGPYTYHYPCPVPWHVSADLETKRRRLARFIGLRGCESQVDGQGHRVRVSSEEEIWGEVVRERERAAEEWLRGKLY